MDIEKLEIEITLIVRSYSYNYQKCVEKIMEKIIIAKNVGLFNDLKNKEELKQPLVSNSDCLHNQFCDKQTIDMKCKSESGCNFKVQSDC